MYYKVKGYIVDVIDNKKVKIEINEDKYLTVMNNVIEYLQKEKKYSVPTDKRCSSMFYININNKTKYNIKNINYDEPNDLRGVEVFITFYTNYYNFSYPIECDDYGEKKYVKRNGYNFIGIKITNTGIFA